MDFLKKHWSHIMLIAVAAAYIGLSLGTKQCPVCISGEMLGLMPEEDPASEVTATGEAPSATWSVRALNGDLVTSEELKGRVSVLVYWATWCSPCRKEVSTLASLRETFRPEDVEIIGVSMDNPEKDLKPFIEQYGVNYTIAHADESLKDVFGEVKSIPTMYIIDRYGRIKHKHIGLMSEQVLRDQIELLVKQSEIRPRA